MKPDTAACERQNATAETFSEGPATVGGSRETQPFFSVVVPCYKVAPYLDAMAASVKNQPFADWECILSYEESPDATLAGCEALAASDPRFRIVRGPRSGSPSTPRNRAFEVARGRYVIWLDGDDYLTDGVLATLADSLRAHGEPDVLIGALETATFSDAGERLTSERKFGFAPEDDGRVFSGPDAMIRMMGFKALPFVGAQIFVCRADFLREKKISFIPGLRHEDEEWSPRVFYYAKRLLVLDQVLFVYCRRPGSIMSTQASAQALEHHVKVDRAIFAFHAGHEFSPALSRALAREALSLFFFHFFYPSRQAGIPQKDRIRCLNDFLEGDGLGNFTRLARFGSVPKRIGAGLVALVRISPCLGRLAFAYFKYAYYPLAMR